MTNPFEIKTIEPTVFVIGQYAVWTIEDEYDSATYSLAYVVRDTTPVTISGALVDSLWQFELTVALANTLTVGTKTVDLVVTRLSDGATATARAFDVIVIAAGGERRTHAQIMVGKIESILENRADSDVGSYSIKSRSLTKMSVSELTDWREYYLAEIARSSAPLSEAGPRNNTLRVRFR